MNWFGPSNGSCSCCQEGECGFVDHCECCENYAVRTRPNVTFTIGGSVGTAQAISSISCGPAATIPVIGDIAGDYVCACSRLFPVCFQHILFSSKMCTYIGTISVPTGGVAVNPDIYHSIIIDGYYRGIRGFPAEIYCTVVSRPVWVFNGDNPNDGINFQNFSFPGFFNVSISSSFYNADIATDTCRPLINENVGGSPGVPGGGQIDVSGVTITATLGT